MKKISFLWTISLSIVLYSRIMINIARRAKDNESRQGAFNI